jgi:POT family proton-dependent oligopeptide transporter
MLNPINLVALLPPMKKIVETKHSKESAYFNLAKIAERSSYYGARTLLVLYMVKGGFGLSITESYEIYGWIGIAVIISQVVGAILGDLIIGNRRSILAGATILGIGMLVLCISSIYSLYFGLGMVVLGSGLFRPNLTANYGKSYLAKPLLLDAGFSMYYLSTNIGALLGSVLIAYLGETFGIKIGLTVCGLFSLISTIPILKTSDSGVIEPGHHSTKQRLIPILIAFLTVGIFWPAYELGNFKIDQIQTAFSATEALRLPQSICSWQMTSSSMGFIVVIFAIFIWTHFYYSQFKKLLVGIILGIIAFATLFFIPESPEHLHIILFLFSLLSLSIAEIHIAPVVQSILTQYVKPRYLAIAISLVFLPPKALIYLFSFYYGSFEQAPDTGLTIAIAMLSFTAIGLIIFLLSIKRLNHPDLEVS